MIGISNSLAKGLSKIVKGNLGVLLHYFVLNGIVGYVMLFVSVCLLQLISGVVNEVASKEELIRINNVYETNPTMLINEPLILICIAVVVAVIGLGQIYVIVATIKSSKIYKQAKERQYQSFGKARFSDIAEVKKLGLEGKGIIFGKMGKNIISKPPSIEGHTLVVGGTGSGKSRGIVIPSLLCWEGSAVIMDIKGELSALTSERRKSYGDVYIFNPEGEGDCYNPIAMCSTIDQAQDLARTLIPLPEKGEPFWAQSAQAILGAFVFEGAKKGYTLSDIAERLCTSPINDLIEHCRRHEMREVRILASITYDLPEKTLGGIMGELKSKLVTIASDDNIRRATSQSDWTPETLEKGATIYLKVSEHLLEQYKDLWTIIISQILKHLSKREERKAPPVLFGLDEMPRLSKINELTNALATLRSRNVHMMCVIQSMAQLDAIYGMNERKIIADNCRFKMVLSATDPETQKYFSDLSGQKTILSKGMTVGAGIMPNISRTEQGTPLIRPEEWGKLHKPILLATNLHPVELELAFWDKEKF